MDNVNIIVECFKPVKDWEAIPFRIGSMAIGFVGLVAAVASAIFGTASTIEAVALGAFSGTLLFGGAVGSIGLVALAVLFACGISIATLPVSHSVVWYGYVAY